MTEFHEHARKAPKIAVRRETGLVTKLGGGNWTKKNVLAENAVTPGSPIVSQVKKYSDPPKSKFARLRMIEELSYGWEWQEHLHLSRVSGLGREGPCFTVSAI